MAPVTMPSTAVARGSDIRERPGTNSCTAPTSTSASTAASVDEAPLSTRVVRYPCCSRLTVTPVTPWATTWVSTPLL